MLYYAEDEESHIKSNMTRQHLSMLYNIYGGNIGHPLRQKVYDGIFS